MSSPRQRIIKSSSLTEELWRLIMENFVYPRNLLFALPAIRSRCGEYEHDFYGTLFQQSDQ